MLEIFLNEYARLYEEYDAFMYTERATGKTVSVSRSVFLADVSALCEFWSGWSAKKASEEISGERLSGRCGENPDGGDQSIAIGMIAENSYEYIAEYFAIILSGNTVVPLNQSFEPERLAEYVREIGIGALLLGEDVGETHAGAAGRNTAGEFLGCPAFDLHEHFRELCRTERAKSGPLESGLERGTEKVSLKSGFKISEEPGRTVLMLLSSGTSGKSKIVELTDRNISAFALDVIKKYDHTGAGSVLCALPLYHIGGIIPALEALARGKTYYISSAKGIMQDLLREQFGRLVLVPAMAKKILDKAEKSEKIRTALRGVRELLCLGAAMDQSLIRSIRSSGMTPLTYYGMTETTGTVSYEGVYRDGACGRVAAYCKVRIENGEILVSGSNVTKGYLHQEEETRKALAGGWLHTGDLGRLDEDGYLYVTGRLKNTIILSNGENVSPEAIEDRLYAMKEILECVVYGKDEGVAVKIYAGKEDREAVESFVEELNQQLTMPERIRHIEISDQELPKNAMGKLDRKEILRQQAPSA